MGDESELEAFMGELVLDQEKFKNFDQDELLHHCMLLDTLGDHTGMLNSAIMYVTRTAESSRGEQRQASEENTERDVFGVACKKYITYRLEQWGQLRDQKVQIATNSLGGRLMYINEYLDNFERDLLSHIYQVIDIIDTVLIPNCTEISNKIFYYKMLADYFRYSIDFLNDGDESQEYMEAISEALANYKYAMKASVHLESTSPIFLALVLNYSVFLNDMQNDPETAIEVAQEAFDEAINGVKYLAEEDHKESTLLLQRLRDNLQLWKNAVAVEHGEGNPLGEFDPNVSQEEPEIEYE